jgi:hypothetical protein
MSGENAEGWKPELNWENDAWIWVDLSDLVGIREIHPNVRRVLEKWSR